MTVAPVQETNTSNSYEIAYEPSLVPPLSLMATEGITVLEAVANYFQQAARVLKPGGRCVCSFFLLDYYRPGQPRPSVFGKSHFNFSHPYIGYEDTFASASADMPEQMTACRLSLIEQLAADAGLVLAQAPVPGLWSGSFDHWVCAQDLVVLQKPKLLLES